MPKTERFFFRLDPGEKEAFQQAAELSGLTLSTWVRQRLRLAAVHELEAAGKQIPFIAPVPLGGPNE